MPDFTITLIHFTWTSNNIFKYKKSDWTDCMMTISTAASQRAFPLEDDTRKREIVA